MRQLVPCSSVLWLLLGGCVDPTTITEPTDVTEPGDDDDDTTWGHSGTTTETGTSQLPPASIVINEIMPGNKSTINGPDPEETPDWVEIVNTGKEPFALTRLQLRNGAQDGIWTGSEDDGSIEPGDHFLIWLGIGSGNGVFTQFQLDKDDDSLIVIVDGVLQEEVRVEGLETDISWSRTPDITGEFLATAWATPGRTNAETVSDTLNVADATVFRTDVVHQIHFNVSDQGYNQLSAGNRPEIHAQMSFDGVALPNIGLKLKGSASYDTMDGKPAFRVDLNEWIPGTSFRGLQAFKLHNGNVLDPTRVRDHITYKLAREAGLMAPRVGWAEVWVHHPSGSQAASYYGIYMIVEAHDDQFIKYFHPEQEETGVILEPNETEGGYWGGDFGSGQVLNWNFEEGPEPPDPLSVQALSMCDTIIGRSPTDANVAELWTYMDKDLLLTYLAWEAVANHTDGYKAPNNWRVFVDGTTHLVSLVPSGAEWTWDNAPPQVFSFGGRAGSWCVSNNGCKHDLAEKVIEVANLVETLDLAGEFRDQSTFLDPVIQRDPRYNSWSTPEQARQTTFTNLNGFPPDARQQVYQTFPDLRP